MIRGAEAGAGTTGPPSTTAAAPSVNELHMSRVSTPATWGEASTSSIVTARWHWASGLREAWSNALTAAAAIWRTVAPVSAMQPLRPGVVEAHEDAAGRVVVLVTPVVQVVPVLGRQAVLDPGHGLGAVARPHLLDAQRQDRAVRTVAAIGRQVQRRAAPGARVVDVDDGRLAQPRLAQPGLAAHAALVVQPPGHGVGDDDEAELVRRHAGVAERLVGHLVGHRLGREVAPAHVGHAGPEDGDVGRAHAGTALSDWLRSSPTKAERSRPKCSTARRAGDHHDDVAGPGVDVAAQRGGTGLGRARHEMALEGLGREPVQVRQPRRALRPGASSSSPTQANTTTPARRRPGSRPASAVSCRSAASAGAYSSGVRKSGTQPSPTAAARRRAAALEPPNHSGTGAEAGSWR